jgi:glutamate synthase (ferredoxin)
MNPAPILNASWHFQERDSCGVGFLVDRQGRASHELLQKALAALACMEHRGGCGGTAKVGMSR